MALHRIADVLPNLENMYRSGEATFVLKVDQVAADADLIGMATLARVARNVTDSYMTGNDVAVAATLARLHRVGERSIHAVWDLEDISS